MTLTLHVFGLISFCPETVSLSLYVILSYSGPKHCAFLRGCSVEITEFAKKFQQWYSCCWETINKTCEISYME